MLWVELLEELLVVWEWMRRGLLRRGVKEDGEGCIQDLSQRGKNECYGTKPENEIEL
jgi:hypothetical protein